MRCLIIKRIKNLFVWTRSRSLHYKYGNVCCQMFGVRGSPSVSSLIYLFIYLFLSFFFFCFLVALVDVACCDPKCLINVNDVRTYERKEKHRFAQWFQSNPKREARYVCRTNTNGMQYMPHVYVSIWFEEIKFQFKNRLNRGSNSSKNSKFSNESAWIWTRYGFKLQRGYSYSVFFFHSDEKINYQVQITIKKQISIHIWIWIWILNLVERNDHLEAVDVWINLFQILMNRKRNNLNRCRAKLP